VRDLRRRVGRTALGLLLLGTVALTGCSEKQQASETLPSASATPSAEDLPPLGPADFPVPDEARTKDAAGAEAFLRYWIDLINWQRDIPAGQPLLELGPECADCRRIAENYDEVAAAGRRYDGGQLRLNDVTEPQLKDNQASINFGLRQEAVVLVDGGGTPVDAGMPMRSNLSSGVTLVWSELDESWLVKSMTLG
jgi:Family of unknown function (DUF6318)